MPASPSASLIDGIKGTKSKPKSKKPASVVTDDAIVAQSYTVENLTQEEAFALVKELTEAVDQNYFRLGGVLAAIQGNEWWRDTEHDTFKAFIEGQFGIHYRKAMYLIGIYTSVVDSGVAFDEFDGIGWSKIKEIAAVVTMDNVKDWVAKAKTMTVLQLRDAVQKAMTGTLDKSDDEPTDAVTTITFKVHTDQKETIQKAVEKAMKEAATDYKGVALEAICMNYLSGEKVKAGPKPKTLLDLMQEAGDPVKVLEAFEKAYPNVNLTAEV